MEMGTGARSECAGGADSPSALPVTESQDAVSKLTCQFIERSPASRYIAKIDSRV
jgi:hypothetical protein